MANPTYQGPYPEIHQKIIAHLDSLNPKPSELEFIKVLTRPEAQWAVEYLLGYAKGMQKAIREGFYGTSDD